MKRIVKYTLTTAALAVALAGYATKAKAVHELPEYKPRGSGNCVANCTTQCGPLCDCCPLSICGVGC
jgi:hypothetical protein